MGGVDVQKTNLIRPRRRIVRRLNGVARIAQADKLPLPRPYVQTEINRVLAFITFSASPRSIAPS